MQTIAESWIEEGFFKGMNEGMGLGCSEGVHVLYETIVEILELRFSTVPQRLKKRLKTIDDLSSLKNLRKKFRIAASIQACERIASEEMSHRAMPLPPFDPAAHCPEIWSAFENALPQEGTALMQAVAKEFFEEGYIKGKYEATSMAIAELAGATAEILELRFGPVPRTLALRLNTVRTFDELSALRSQLREATSIADCERIIGRQA